MKTVDTLSGKDNDNTEKVGKEGKNNSGNTEDIKTCPTMKKDTLSTENLEYKDKVEFPNYKLNQLLQKKFKS